MTIYDKPTKTLMRDFVDEMLAPGQVFTKRDAVNWFRQHYPKIRDTTVQMHVEGMSINVKSRTHAKPGSGHDLFIKVGPGNYRIWNQESDPRPFYGAESIPDASSAADFDSSIEVDESEDEFDRSQSGEFAYESDLRNYLVRNLSNLENGLTVYEEEDVAAVEFPVGGRYIDILAIDGNGDFVVIELKVSKGYERTIGQLLRYMAWVKQNMADQRKVRGIIVASEISNDLKLAASLIPGVSLAEYELSFNIKPAS